MTNLNGNGRTLTAIRPDVFQIFLQDEDGQNILSIDDGALRQSLSIEIVNTSGRTIQFQGISDQPSLDNYHFSISFRPGTLLLTEDNDKRITLKETGEEWQMTQQDNTFYLLLNSSGSRVIENGERITLTLENIGAAPEGGSRGTRVEIKYNYLQYQDSNETISGNRLQYLNIVNQRGKKQIPLYVGFLGSNTILNDGTENELTLTIQTLPNQNASLTFLESPEITAKDTTRWQGDIVKFIKEKIPNFEQEIEKIQQNPDISDASKQFFALLKESVDLNDSFQDFQAKLTNLTLEDSDKEIIFTILINNLGIIIQDDLNAILTQLKGLLYSQEPTEEELAQIKAKIQEIIQRSENFKVIKSELNPNGALELKGLDGESPLDQAAKFTISFDVAPDDDPNDVTTTNDDSKNWALVKEKDADETQVYIVEGQENWIFGGIEKQGITPRWNFICKQGLQLQDRTEILRFKIEKLKTRLLSGYANLYVHYENIPGYWDGYISVPIHKGSLVYRENSSGVGCVGIGTDEPQAKLHVKSANGVDGLKVEGNTAIEGKQLSSLVFTLEVRANKDGNDGISIENIGGGNPQLRFAENGVQYSAITSNANTGDMYFWTKDHGNLFNLIDGNVGIGTTDPDGNKLKVQGNTAIAGNLSVDGNSIKIGGNFPNTTLKIEAFHETSRPATTAAIELRGYGDRAKGLFISDRDRNDKWFIGKGYWSTSRYNGIGIGYNSTGEQTEYPQNAKFFINTEGNVGIGTTSPVEKLHIQGTGTVRGLVKTSGDLAYWRAENSTKAYGVGVTGSTFRIWDYSTERRIDWTGANSWNFPSDCRSKTEIENEENILGRLIKLDVKNYRKKDNLDAPTKEIGFIAQDVKPLFPSLVGEADDSDLDKPTLTLSYSTFGVLAVGGLKELKLEKDAEIAQLKYEINELKTQIQQLSNMVPNSIPHLKR